MSSPDWLTGCPPPHWADYSELMACNLVELDKRPGVCPMGIGETLCRDLTKPFMRKSGDQAKTACGKLQLCAGLEAGIEGATHAVRKRIIERSRARRSEGEARRTEKEDSKNKEAG